MRRTRWSKPVSNNLGRPTMADGLRHRIAAGSCALLALTWSASAAEGPPKRGGTLTYLIPADSPPSFDGHREGTFAMVHATAPFYSTLIRINPVNPSSTTDFVCDLCTGMPEPGDSGNLKTKSSGDGCLKKAIEKTVLRFLGTRTFSHGLDPKLPFVARET